MRARFLEVEKQPKYRKYVQTMERVLQSFDTIAEWPDMITFLAKLIRVCDYFIIDSK
jgi:hypothetical protein